MKKMTIRTRLTLVYGGMLLAGTMITLALLVLLRHRITGERPELLRTNAKAHFYGTGKTWAYVVAKLSTCATRATAPYGRRNQPARSMTRRTISSYAHK